MSTRQNERRTHHTSCRAGHTWYLAQADKAARTAMMLTERLDHHRNQGKQQIVVKHTTVNADQAVITDTVVTGGGKKDEAKLLAVVSEKPMEIIEAKQKETVGGGGTKPK